MFAIVNLGYFFLYGGGFALMKDTRAASSVACPWPYPEAKVYDPQGFYEEAGQPGPYFPGIWSGWQSGQPDGRPDVDAARRRRPVRRRRWLTHAASSSPGRRAASAWRPPPTSTAPGGRWSPPCARPTTPLERLRALTGASPAIPPHRRPPRPRRPGRRSRPPPATILDTVGAPDGIVHNAGIAGVGCLEELPMPTWEQMFSTNFFGPVRLTEALLPAMRAAGRGRIVMVSSMGAIRGMPGIGAYSATKGALERWAESLSFEVAPFGLGVTVLVAGSFKTDILELTPTYADPDGPYAALHHGLETSGRRFLRFAQPPERFAPAVERALAEPRPFRRHGVGIDGRLLLVGSRLLPTALLQRITTRAVGIPRPGALRGDPSQRASVTHHPERGPKAVWLTSAPSTRAIVRAGRERLLPLALVAVACGDSGGRPERQRAIDERARRSTTRPSACGTTGRATRHVSPWWSG